MKLKTISVALLAAVTIGGSAAGEIRARSNVTPDGYPLIVPRVQRFSPRSGNCRLPEKITVAAPAAARFEQNDLVEALRRFLPSVPVTVTEPGTTAFCKLELTNEGTPASPQGYILTVTPDGVHISGRTTTGLFYGVQTFKMMLRHSDGDSLRACRIEDWPTLELRGVFLNLRNLDREKLKKFKSVIAAMGELKLNLLVLEFADNFPLSGSPFTKRKFTLTKEDIAELTAFAKERHFEIVPHLQCWSHVAWLENHPNFISMLEDNFFKGWDSAYCPLNQQAVGLTLQAIRESISLIKPKYFHICLDELEWGKVGCCPQCKKVGTAKLMTDHILMLQNAVLNAGAVPWIYHDSLFPGRSLRGERVLTNLDRRTGIVFWDYSMKINTEIPDYFRKHGFNVLGMGRGQEPDNPRQMAQTVRKNGGMGSVLSYWNDHVDNRLLGSRHVSNRAYLGTVLHADCCWNVDATPWMQLDYDPVHLAKRLLDPATPPAATATPLPIRSVLNYRFGDDPDFPMFKDAGEMRRTLAGLPECFDLNLAPDGGFYGVMLSADAKLRPGVVTIPLPQIKATRLVYLLTAGRSDRTLFFQNTVGARHYPRIASMKVNYTDGSSRELVLFYNYNLTDWNSGIGGYGMRQACFGTDDRGAVCALGVTTHELDREKTLKSLSFFSNRREGIRPVLLAVSAVDAQGEIPPLPEIGQVAERIRRNPLPRAKTNPERDFVYADFSAGLGKAEVGGHGFARKIDWKIEKCDGRPVLRIDVPPKSAESAVARVYVDVPVDKKDLPALSSMFFDFQTDQPFGIQRTDCYVMDAETKRWKVRHTFHRSGDSLWQSVRFPFSMMAQHGGKLENEEIAAVRVSFWMHNRKPQSIRLARIGCSTAKKISTPLLKK